MSGSFPSLSQSGGRAFPLPTIAEDTLHYVLHLPSSDFSDSASSATATATATALLITQYVHDLLPNPWIWNRDSWELKVQPNNNGTKTVLEGTIRVGDAVDDEWLVVWLLKQISIKWPDLIIGIRDSDGEFLLIEAANELPSWVSPENAQNRLWLHNAHLHLIPLSIRSSTAHARQIPKDDDDDEETRYDPEAFLSENDALRAVRTGKYRAEGRMEQAVWDRIACYPDALKTHQHRTKAYLPIPIAKALSENPELIQRAVEGFYVRDPAQLRAASRMTHFSPSPSILSSVTMTRAAYAQLQGQVFHPPRIFGPEWHVRQVEGETSSSSSSSTERERRWRDLGVKVSTGFEIMYREGGKKGRSGENNVDEDDSLVKSAEYKSFLDTLKRAGYFGGEVEGSAKWNEREMQARKEYVSIKATDTASQRPSFAYLVDSAIASSSSTDQSLAVSPSAEEDSEEWLDVSPDELDSILQRAAASTSTSGRPGAVISESLENGQGAIGEEHGQALHDLAKQVEEFVGGQGDVEGARFEDELSDDDMNDDDDDEDDEMQEREVLEAGRQERLDNLVPSLPESEWGQKSVPEPKPEVGTPSVNIDKGSRIREKKVGFQDTDMLPASMRPPRFTKEHYDGVESDSEDDDVPDEADLPPAGTLGRKIALMKWGEGEDKSATVEELNEDDEEGEDEDEEEEDRRRKARLTLDDDIDDEMQRRVWEDDIDEEDQPMVEMEDADVDMLDEQEEFLKFSREALGISEEMWQGILGDRRARGAFVPEVSTKAKSNSESDTQDQSIPKTNSGKGIKNVNFAQPSTKPTPTASTTAPVESIGIPPPPPEVVGKNASLDSFESVMRAMDAELARVKGRSSKANSAPVKRAPSQPATSKLKPGKSASAPLPKLPTEADLEEMDDSDLEAMDEELRKALKSAGIDDVDEDEDEDGTGAGELQGDQKREYEMMRDFLQSYQSQAGQSGVVGNLFGRLGKEPPR